MGRSDCGRNTSRLRAPSRQESRQIGETLRGLVRTGILKNGDDSEGYSLAGDESQRATLQRIANAARSNNRFRLQLNYHITKATLAKYKTDRR